MEEKLVAFQQLVKLFNEHGFSLYLVGGTVRDYLLNLPLTDMDAVTDATPEEMKTFLGGDYTFSKMGSIKTKFENIKFDITTLRKEEDYQDYRHPSKIHFVKTLEEDVSRRDFSINAMYLDKDLKLVDFVGGLKDLNQKTIRIIGCPDKRIKEDPLRILRAIRFSLMLHFSIDSELEKAMLDNIELLKLLTKDKVKQEIKKITNVPNEDIAFIFNKYGINYLLDMIK